MSQTTRTTEGPDMTVTSERKQQTEGWVWPRSSTTAHYFGPDNKALCGRHALLLVVRYDAEADAPASPDDCGTCRTLLDHRLAG